jgi:hypothetical protein
MAEEFKTYKSNLEITLPGKTIEKVSIAETGTNAVTITFTDGSYIVCDAVGDDMTYTTVELYHKK